MSINQPHPPSAPLKAHYQKPTPRTPRTPPSPLAIATSVVKRLINEQRTYVLELESQQRRIDKIETEEEGEGEDGNRSFRLGQEKAGLQETRNVFGPLATRIIEAVAKLEGLIGTQDDKVDPNELKTATDTVKEAKEAIKNFDAGQGGKA